MAAPATPRRLLLVDDDEAMCAVLAEELAGRGYAVEARSSVPAGLAALGDGAFDVLLTDLHMHGASGLELVRAHTSLRAEAPSIVMTAFGTMESAVGAIRAGAYDFLIKPFKIDELCLVLDRALDHLALRREVLLLRDQVAASQPWPDLIGSSEAMRRVTSLLRKVADSNANVLIQGETGTGKEVVARCLHTHGWRAQGPFLAVNCAALPEALLESELFGHVRGAFTDARADRVGLFEQANGGTLFLDEIGELPPALQPKLLRALQERRVRPIGGSAERGFDARIVTASNRDLESAVHEKVFREDLYFRVNVINVELPPLRERGGDVLELAQHFVRGCAARMDRAVEGFDTDVARRLAAYPWPGNVRELENVIERAVTLTEHRELVPSDLPDRLRAHVPAVETSAGPRLIPLAEVERGHILRVLDAVGGHRTEAARILGLDRKTLYRKLERYGLE